MKERFTIFKIFLGLVAVCFLIVFVVFIQELNRSSNIRGLISQIGAFDSAIKGFSNKYESLPGDLTSTIEFGLSEENTDGNDDGIINDEKEEIRSASGEVTNFWLHLSRSKFITQNYDGKKNAEAKNGSTFPVSKIGSEKGITVFGVNNKNYYQIGVVGANQENITMSDSSLTTSEALAIDLKLDDAMPKTGRITAASGDVISLINEDNKKCISKTKEYNRKTSTPSCQLRIEIGTVEN